MDIIIFHVLFITLYYVFVFDLNLYKSSLWMNVLILGCLVCMYECFSLFRVLSGSYTISSVMIIFTLIFIYDQKDSKQKQ